MKIQWSAHDIVFSFPLLLGFVVCIFCKNIQLRQRQSMLRLVRPPQRHTGPTVIAGTLLP